MVLAGIRTEPQYSIGKAERPPVFENIKTPDPIYSQSKTSNIKFAKPPEWRVVLMLPIINMPYTYGI